MIGSLVSSLYSTDVEGSLDALPPEAQAAAESSVGAASAIAAQLPANAASELLATTGDAFTQAMGSGLLVAARSPAPWPCVVIRFLPAREFVEGKVASHDLRPTAATGEPSLRRKAGVWMILAALVLGAAYLASRPGSDTPAANGQGSAPEFAAIERFVQDEMAAQRIPGLALGIVENDRITYLRGFGKADDSGRPVTPSTPFIIGSLSKSFTALAIMQLVEAGKIELDAPVQRYLPWFRVADERASAAITVRHLLNQTSGLSTKTGRTFQGNGDISDAALERTVRKLSSVALTAPVGKTYQYSTVNYAVLGLIVQTVAGRSYESYVQTEILDPLQMHGSFTSAAAGGAPRPRHRLPLLVRPAESGRPSLQPWARPGRVSHLRRRGHEPLPDRPAEPWSVPVGVRALTRGSGRAPPTGRPDTGDGHLVRDGLVRRPDQRDPGDPSPGRDVQLPRECRARAPQPDGSHRADERGELHRPVPQPVAWARSPRA